MKYYILSIEMVFGRNFISKHCSELPKSLFKKLIFEVFNVNSFRVCFVISGFLWRDLKTYYQQNRKKELFVDKPFRNSVLVLNAHKFSKVGVQDFPKCVSCHKIVQTFS
jgi:hypothetical protein